MFIINYLKYDIVGKYYVFYVIILLILILALVGVIGEVVSKRKVEIYKLRRAKRIAAEAAAADLNRAEKAAKAQAQAQAQEVK